MHAMVLNKLRAPLEWTELPDRQPGPGEIRVKVSACGVCRTDLHVVDGELPHPNLPIIPGHEIVGRIDAIGPGVEGLAARRTRRHSLARPYLRRLPLLPRRSAKISATIRCSPAIRATAALRPRRSPMRASPFRLAKPASDVALAPLLCAGLIGWRSLVIAGEAKKLGLYGFGAAAHIIAQVATWQGRRCLPSPSRAMRRRRPLPAASARSGLADRTRCRPNRSMPRSSSRPVGAWCPLALQAVRKGGRVVCAGIHMSDIPSFPYRSAVGRAAAGLRRQSDPPGWARFLQLAPQIGIVTQTTRYPLRKANEALADLRAGRFDGAAVLVLEQSVT